MPISTADLAKRAAAERAVAMVEDGMRLGIGTGSTAAWFVRLLGERVLREGLSITGVATSSSTQRLATEAGLRMASLEAFDRLDLTVDGADEVDPDLTLIKGGGGALLQEKIVAAASARMLVIADAGKRVTTLGAFPLPVEVVRFGWTATRSAIERLLAEADVDGHGVSLRERDGAALVTDEGHLILDLHLRRIGDPASLAIALSVLPGVVEHGLFVGLASAVIYGEADGATEFVERGAVPVDIGEEMRIQDA